MVWCFIWEGGKANTFVFGFPKFVDTTKDNNGVGKIVRPYLHEFDYKLRTFATFRPFKKCQNLRVNLDHKRSMGWPDLLFLSNFGNNKHSKFLPGRLIDPLFSETTRFMPQIRGGET